MTWSEELAEIVPAAVAAGVDPAFVAAVRWVEHGGPGREFGVVSVRAPAYLDQLHVTIVTVARRLGAFGGNALEWCEPLGQPRRVRYSMAFIEAFAGSWAPVGASNDPGGLNAGWLPNVCEIYGRMVDAGVESDALAAEWVE